MAIHDLEDRESSAAEIHRIHPSGRMEAQHVAEQRKLFDCDYRDIILDLQDLSLADRDAVRFLRTRKASGMKLENTPAYVPEWIDREKD